MELKNSEVERNNIAPLEDPHEISKRLLEEHRRTMEEWFQAQLDHLVERQPCASDAVALEWLMKRSSVTKTTKGEPQKLKPYEERRLKRILDGMDNA
ncbi:hypothetical protein TCAL_05298 [Tigriopus californicus]|uniref:Uncharacterized protein n=1 Tax=Tigriopus californicus TaxID=6832 RepID=A0A553P1V4_TIGCA|nr:hypothetical protein TCAL_05298 [Tigriopus californicus]